MYGLVRVANSSSCSGAASGCAQLVAVDPGTGALSKIGVGHQALAALGDLVAIDGGPAPPARSVLVGILVGVIEDNGDAHLVVHLSSTSSSSPASRPWATRGLVVVVVQSLPHLDEPGVRLAGHPPRGPSREQPGEGGLPLRVAEGLIPQGPNDLRRCVPEDGRRLVPEVIFRADEILWRERCGGGTMR